MSREKKLSKLRIDPQAEVKLQALVQQIRNQVHTIHMPFGSIHIYFITNMLLTETFLFLLHKNTPIKPLLDLFVDVWMYTLGRYDFFGVRTQSKLSRSDTKRS